MYLLKPTIKIPFFSETNDTIHFRDTLLYNKCSILVYLKCTFTLSVHCFQGGVLDKVFGMKTVTQNYKMFNFEHTFGVTLNTLKMLLRAVNRLNLF